MCGGCTSGSENKESKVGGRLLKQLFWVCSPFTLMSSPKRVNRWWDAEPELCLVENLAGSAVLQPQNAAEKADFCTTYIYSFCCTREEIAEDLVPVPEIPTELQGCLCCCWKYVALWPLLVTNSSNNSFELSGFPAKVPTKLYSLQ